MTAKRFDIPLEGCAPVPLAHYLKALGILRLVSEQVDSQAQGWWEYDTFWLRSTLDQKGLTEFFLEKYEPTPIVAPWNGGSGFYKKWDPIKSSFKEREAVDTIFQIERSTNSKFENYRTAIQRTKTALVSIASQVELKKTIRQIYELASNENWTAKKTKSEIEKYLSDRLLFGNNITQMAIDKTDKDILLQALRGNVLLDEGVGWLDTTTVLLTGCKKNRTEAPLLGSGGNIGNSDFSFRFMKSLTRILSLNSKIQAPCESSILLSASIFGTCVSGYLNISIDQFDPGNAGGANMTNGFMGKSQLNPWDYVFMIEGALMISGSTTRRLNGNRTQSAFPFSVNSSFVGNTTDDSDETRGEIWLPLWKRPVSANELTALYGEGKMTVGRRPAISGLDAARSISSLGVDRGIVGFTRFQFQKRLGDNYLASEIGRFKAQVKSEVNLIKEIEQSEWLESFRKVSIEKTASKAVKFPNARRALRKIETAILELCQRGSWQDVQKLLIALGEAEAAVAISPKLQEKVNPIPPLSSQWIEQAYPAGGDIEFRLAASLASVYHEKVGPLRRHLEPLDQQKGNKPWDSKFLNWSENDKDPNIVWSGGSLVQNMIAVLQRRMVEVIKQGKQTGDEVLFAPVGGRYAASLGDIASFIAGDVDDEKIDRLLRGLILIRWKSVKKETLRKLKGKRTPHPFAPYALLKLCFLPDYLEEGIKIPLQPAILHRAVSGDISSATKLAARRLRGSGLPPAVEQICCPTQQAKRTVAALLFPVWMNDAEKLKRLVIRRNDKDDSSEEKQETESEPVIN